VQLGEHRIGRYGAIRCDASRRRLGDGRLDFVAFLIAKQPILAAVRIEPCDGDTRTRDAEVAASLVRKCVETCATRKLPSASIMV
jgi:hypothetical protein